MKNNCNFQNLEMGRLLWAFAKKIPLVMKLFIICLFCSIGMVQAVESYAQNARISLKVEEETVADVLNEIEEASEFDFFYNNTQIDLNRRVSVSAQNSDIFAILNDIFAGTEVRYTVLDKKIILSTELSDNQQQESRNVVKGKVIDATGEPVIGATVKEVGTNNGIVTDIDGNFSLAVQPGASLEISFVGYKTETVKAVAGKSLTVTLKEDNEMLEEVVVVGYGVQKKVNLTGAVSTVNVDKQLKGRAVSNISSGLSGLVPGLDVRQSSGQPGKDDAVINIRGIGTLNNSSPLIIIDGIAGSMSDINPNDIESVSVLKDASSAAIYGSRAANGVVLITTKKGQQGKPKITYNGIFSRQEATNLFDVISDYPTTARITNEGFSNVSPGATPAIPESTITAWEENRDNPILYPNTNWLETIFKPTWRMDNNISISGGTDAILYNVGLGILNNEGIMEGTGYDRYNLKINLESKINKWITVGVNSNLQFNTLSEPYESGYIMANLAMSSPSALPQHPDGRYGATMAPGEDNIGANMLAFNNARSVKGRGNRFMGKLYLTYTPIKNLVFEGNYGLLYNTLLTKTELHYEPMWNFQTESIVRSPFPENLMNQQMYNEVWQSFYFTGNYNFSINKKHNFNILGGFNSEVFKSDYYLIGRGGMPDFDEFQLDLSTSTPWTNGNAQEWALLSGFVRLNYDYDNKYLFEFNYRADGSSRFSKGNRWGHFPSVSVGWRVSEEAFIKDNLSWVNNLKLRLSYGHLGNNNIGNNYSFASLYATTSYQSYTFGGSLAQGAAAASIPNKNLTWEKTEISNVGIDASLWECFNVTFDVYKRDTKGILITAPAPLVLGGLNQPYQNLANVVNKGWELSLNYNKKFNKDWSLSSTFNLSKSNSVIDKYDGREPIIGGNSIIGDGYEYGAYYGYICDGIFRTEEDIKNHAPQKFGNELGDLIYRDIDNSGFVDENDRTVIGKSTPDYVLGLNVMLGYKNFDFSVLFQSLLNYDVWSLDNWDTPLVSKGRTYRTKWLDRWTPDNINASLPRMTSSEYTANVQSSSFWLSKADYLRMKNIQIGYTFPKWQLIKKLNIENLRVFVSADNLFTITPFDGLDPETAQLSGQSHDYDTKLTNNHPNVRQFSFGLNLIF